MAKILGEAPSTAAPVGADVSVVGRGLRIQGECEVPGRLVVEGHITGDVRAAQLEVVPGGRVDGSVSGPDGKAPASSVVVAGRVGGEVRRGPGAAEPGQPAAAARLALREECGHAASPPVAVRWARTRHRAPALRPARTRSGGAALQEG